MTAERAGGEGEFVCRMDGRALDDWQGERGRDDVLCSNEARAEDEVEGRKKRLLQPRQAQPRRRTRRNVNSTRRGYCYDLRRTTSATTATAFHCTRWVVVVVASSPGSAGTPPTFPSASHAFLTPSPYIYLSPSLPSSSLSLTRHAAPAKPHRYRILPSVPPTPRPPPRREGYRAPSEDRGSC